MKLQSERPGETRGDIARLHGLLQDLGHAGVARPLGQQRTDIAADQYDRQVGAASMQ